MNKSKNQQSASLRSSPALGRKVAPPDGSQSLKMTGVKTMLASGQPIPNGPVFADPHNQLKQHGDPIQKGVHAVGAPLSRWRLIASAICIQGQVYDGSAAGDSDTNFELVIPKRTNGDLSDQAKAINQKIDIINQTTNQNFSHIEDFAQNNNPQDPGRIYIHCEVDRNRLDILRADLAGMMSGELYEICGQLVMDTWHGGLYEIHPVQIINKL